MSTGVLDSVLKRFVDGSSTAGVLGLSKVGLDNMSSLRGRTGNSLSSSFLSCERVVTMVAFLESQSPASPNVGKLRTVNLCL